LKNGKYKGGTQGSSCPSDLRGAKYATSIITLKEVEMVSWDQGFDANGKQVWGSTNGGYVFVKER
ncbi:MAG: CpcT/CpeT family chromophore lyase, partial [Bacteroidota bacterium]